MPILRTEITRWQRAENIRTGARRHAAIAVVLCVCSLGASLAVNSAFVFTIPVIILLYAKYGADLITRGNLYPREIVPDSLLSWLADSAQVAPPIKTAIAARMEETKTLHFSDLYSIDDAIHYQAVGGSGYQRMMTYAPVAGDASADRDQS